MNPIIKFTTLFGLLAVELAIKMEPSASASASRRSFLAVALVFVYRSFYGMRIEAGVKAAEGAGVAARGVGPWRSASLRPIRGRRCARRSPPSRCSRSTASWSSPGPRRRSTSSSRATARSSADALAGDRILAVPSLFGKSDAHALRPPLRAVCGAGIIEAEERYDDGRYDVVLRGLARVRLLEELPPAKLYREFRAEILEDVLPSGGAAALAGRSSRGCASSSTSSRRSSPPSPARRSSPRRSRR